MYFLNIPIFYLSHLFAYPLDNIKLIIHIVQVFSKMKRDK
jgi:hypothetical protein